MSPSLFHPDLTRARFLPRTMVLPWNLPILRALTALTSRRSVPGVEMVAVNATVSVRLWRPSQAASPAPAVLSIHGGGMVMGSAAQDDPFCREISGSLGVVVASVEYRLAPEHPFPAPLDDCYQALSWLARQPYVDPARIAVAGASAGGGLAAGLTLMVKERGEMKLVGQALTYPMLDDRTCDRNDFDRKRLRMWNQRSNRFGWDSYLRAADRSVVSPLAAPARCEDLAGLPPAWIGVGSNDLLHDEDVAYAAALTRAGVPCELLVVPGAYHGFDLVEASAPISKSFARARREFLMRVLEREESPDL